MYPKQFCLSILLLTCIHILPGQTYFTTAGLRMGSDFGLSLKQRILKKTTGELILFSESSGRSNMGVTLLYDQHKSIITRNFNLFYGAGLTRKLEYFNSEQGLTKSTSTGIPLQVGIEFTIGKINLSWDYTPILYISTKSNAFSSSKGVSIRYVFITAKEGKRMIKQSKKASKKRKKKRKK
ncbi:MAG: hypothetical protein ABI844_04610 [Saprospiraceae bacterium]